MLIRWPNSPTRQAFHGYQSRAWAWFTARQPSGSGAAAAAQVFTAGGRGQVFTAGQRRGQVYVPGAVAGGTLP